MDKNRLISALYEISMNIKPENPGKLVETFLITTSRNFGFSYAYAEVPKLNLKIEIPKKAVYAHKISFEKKACRIIFGGKKEIPAEYFSAIELLVEKLDSVLECLLLADERYRKIVENIKDIIILVNNDGVVVEANNAAEKVLGKIIGKKLDKKWYDGFITHEGRFYSSSIYNLKDVGKVVIVSDITEKVKLEKEKEFVEKIIETANSLIVGLDEKGRIVMFNRKCEEITGYAREEVLGKNWFDIFVPRVEYTLKIFKKTLEIGWNSYIHPIRAKTGEKIISWSNTVVEREGERIIVAIGNDITDEVSARRRAEELSELFRVINKIMRHDILNDLSIVVGALELYMENKDVFLIEKAIKAAYKSINLIKEIRQLESLALSGKTLKPTPIKPVLEELAKYYSIPINIDGNCIVLADEAISSLFDNIIRNAVIHGKTNRIDIKVKRKNGVCEVRIADYGRGIPNEIKKKIFDEGFSHGETKGTGLGLYVAKKVMERYGGSISIEDNNPKGAVFVLRFKAVWGKMLV
ncbi:PAS domain S-box [Archaeoglobus sulfaticallidus PM70-1]|uniref:PAS domain S-box n=1 Tax=Archaeoglobus sulfaticallidus PM70-1 TaxID=387631 RepID=N0BH98_9EURY|nr:PAS domain S-box protein [Archaeoglobus sulfaticallidus]AGK61682.1 PAS domain S-box [Archaeoglobus sulfaticallidus PM70-1]